LETEGFAAFHRRHGLSEFTPMDRRAALLRGQEFAEKGLGLLDGLGIALHSDPTVTSGQLDGQRLFD